MYGFLSARRSRARSTCAHTHHSFRRTPALCCRRFSSMEPSTRSGSWQMPCSVEITHIHSPQSSNTCRNIGINWVWKIRYLGVRPCFWRPVVVPCNKSVRSTAHHGHIPLPNVKLKRCVFKILSLRPLDSFKFHLNSYSKSQTVSSCFPRVHAHHQATKYLACNWPTRKLILEMKRNRLTGLEETLHAPSELPLHCLLI